MSYHNLWANVLKRVTKMDAMPNSAFSMENKAEAMYFKKARDFFETRTAHIIFNAGKDETEEMWI